MLRTILFFIFCTLIMLMTKTGWSQRKVRVPEGFGTLNQAIRNDTTTGGARFDPNTVYILKRGGVYLLSGAIVVSDFNLALEAEPGTGPRPFIQMGFLDGDPEIDEVFPCTGNIKLKSVHVTCFGELGKPIRRVITLQAPNLRADVTDCIIDRASQAMFRVEGSGNKIYIRNSSVSRIGVPNNPDNGRVIDSRNVLIDSVVIENSTLYNITSRIIRLGDGPLGYVRLNQNTLVNTGQQLLTISLAPSAVSKFVFTNNIVVNPRFNGNRSTVTTPSITLTNASAPQIQIANNNVFFENEIQQVWVEIGNTAPPLVAPENAGFVTNTISEVLSFSNRPGPPVEITRQLELFGIGTNVPDWDWVSANGSNKWELDAISFHDFSYSTTSTSYTGSDTGEPLGDLRWFPGFEVISNLEDLVKEAEDAIAQFDNNSIIGFGSAQLSALQTTIANAKVVTGNAGSTRSQTSSAFNTLRASLDSFLASLIVTEVEEKNEDEINYYPNPVKDLLFISSRGQRVFKKFSVCNSSGIPVFEAGIEDLSDPIDMSAYAPGIYFVKVVKSNGSIRQYKIVKLQ